MFANVLTEPLSECQLDAIAEVRLQRLFERSPLARPSDCICGDAARAHNVDDATCDSCECRLFIPLARLAGGAATAWSMTDTGRTKLLNGTFDLDTDSFKMALFLSASNLGAASTTYAGVTSEHANANGYLTGGIAVTLTLSGTTTVTVDISVDPVWTAAGGPIQARFAAIYEVAGDVLFKCTLDSTPADVSATDGNTLTVAAAATGIVQLA